MQDPQPVDGPTGPQDKQDQEAKLFESSSERAQQLFRESKRVRRQVERKLWWQANKPKPEGEQ